jgi:RHS repeat-associated protein
MRNQIIVLALCIACPAMIAVAQGGTTGGGPYNATITVVGSEQQVAGVWDAKSITISFNGFTETVSPGQFSSSASIASAFSGKFARDYAKVLLSAKVVCGTGSSLITFQLPGTNFGTLSVTGSTTSFQMSPTGFASSGSQIADTGTVTLTVSGVLAATTNYGAGATPSTIATGLAAGVTPGSFVTLTAANNQLSLLAKQAGAGTNYAYSIQTTSYDSIDFSKPSFVYPVVSGSLAGGANAGTGTSKQIYSYASTYDGVGNVQNSADSVLGNWTFSYDTLNRLRQGASSSGPFSSQYPYICWAYDSFGNRTAESPQATACPASESNVLPTVTYSSSNNNQVVSAGGIGAASGYTFSGAIFQYDGAGDVKDDGSNQYLYDAEGRLCAVYNYKIGNSMMGYLYDADGTRVAKGNITKMSCDPTISGFTTTSDYILGVSGEQVTEMAANQGVLSWKHSNIWAGGALLGTYDSVGLHFYFDDPLGSRRAQTNYAGAPEQTCVSLPYGNAETCPPSPTEHLFTGKERDVESGLDYFGARYFASSVGRWMSPDWSAKEEPVPYAKLDDPQSLNLYDYVRNNPLSSIDADGHCSPAELCAAIRDSVSSGGSIQDGTNNYNKAQQKTGHQPDGSYIAPTGPGTPIGNITDPAKPLPPMIGNGQCVTGCSRLSGVTPDTSQWTPGTPVSGNGSIPIGTAIATFGADGKFRSDGSMNSGIYMGQAKNGGIVILDQWTAHGPSAAHPQGSPAHPEETRTVRYDAKDGGLSNSARYYRVIIVH